MAQKHNIPLLYTSILYLFGFLLFLEWLYPVKKITETQSITVFIIYAFFCFAISMFQLKWWLSFPIKLLGFLFILDQLFMTERLFSRSWFYTFGYEIVYNVQLLFSQQWYSLTGFFRTLLFLLIIWIMSYLIFYWFVLMRKIFLFIFFTFIYLTVLDTFTIYDGKWPIIRVFIIAFLSLGMVHFSKLVEKETLSFPWLEKSHKWALPLIGVVLFATIFGYSTPKFSPQWPDPIPYIKSAASQGVGSSGTGVRKVGYGENDSYLGGSFIQDDTPVFQVASPKQQYWRIETKDVYTGKGWETSAGSDYKEQVDGAISLKTFADDIETEEGQVLIKFEAGQRINRLVYPYGIHLVEAAEGIQFYLDRHTEVIQPQLSGEVIKLDRYTVTYAEPMFSIESLKESGNEDPEEIKEKYTSLPDIPARIGELAADIASSYDNRYDIVRAIEQYFNRHEFEYQTEDVPYPAEDQDYVDQFLFETQAGYCDNFSTAMVVMLRTLDIPARWVKGFTGGEYVGTTVTGANGELNVYEITNSNAHSWVEVYFPNIGWVPFEPTQGFQNFTEIRSTAVQEEIDIEDTEQEQEHEFDPVIHEEELWYPDEFGYTELDEAIGQQETNQLNPLKIFVVFLIVALVFWILFKTRYRWITWYVYLRFKYSQNQKAFEKAYMHLLTILGHYTWARKPEQTLREYAEQIDERYTTNKMSELTNYYEQLLYNNKELDVKKDDLVVAWRQLVKRVQQ